MNDTYCAAMIYPGTYYDQPEYCEEEVAGEGEEYCVLHREWYAALEDLPYSEEEDLP